MPLPWVRLDTGFPLNPKLLAMLRRKDGHRAAFVYLCSLSISGGQGTDGFITSESLPWVHGRNADAELLAEFGFWIPQPGGWLINGWDEFQQSNEETQLRRKRAQAAAEARWNGHEPMTDAERAKHYRDRKKEQASLCASRCSVTMQRHSLSSQWHVRLPRHGHTDVRTYLRRSLVSVTAKSLRP